MKILLAVAALLILIGLAITIIGALSPRDHTTTLQRDYAVPAARLYELARNYEDYPTWRTGVKAMKRDGSNRFIETSSHGSIPYKLSEDKVALRLVSTIDDPALPFSGTWTIECIDKGNTSVLRITEAGSVSNPIFRFVSRYVISHDKTIRTYLDDVARKLGAP